MNDKLFKDKELERIVNMFSNKECRDYLYKLLAEHGENWVWGILLVYFLNQYSEFRIDGYRESVQALMTFIPDDSRKQVVSLIRPEYLWDYCDRTLIDRIINNDFPSRFSLGQEERLIGQKKCRLILNDSPTIL